MIRYKVVRKDIRYKNKTYSEGALLPETFTERDKFRLLYPSRVEEVTVPDNVNMGSPSVAEQKSIVTELKKKNAKGDVKVKAKATVNGNMIGQK